MINLDDVLNLEVSCDDRPLTIRSYLINLLSELWAQRESFSGKRPFGDSDWEFEIYTGLIKAGFVDGELDDYGYVESLDQDEADMLIQSCIASMDTSFQK